MAAMATMMAATTMACGQGVQARSMSRARSRARARVRAQT